MSEPEAYEIWQKEARLLHERLGASRYLLGMDEIRAGGTCRACKNRKMSMARILGDCITRQCDILRQFNPDAEIFIWSDMLDPNHNAHADYYLVDGDTLENPIGWLEVLDKTQGAVGIMYTTWQRKYDLLRSFGQLVTR